MMASLDYATAPTSFRGDSPAAAQDCELADRRELALVAVERTRMPMMVSDARQPDAPIVLANQAFLDLTGYTAEEVVGRNCRFLQGPETAESDIAKLRDALVDIKDHIEIELLNYRKDGSKFLNQLIISPVFNDDDELIYYFASQKDITQQRRAEALEATERRLLMEVDHRAMNALALVHSIVSLSRSDSVEGLARSINGRIGAIARAHRLLSETGWNGSDMLHLVKGQMPPHLGVRIDVFGGKVSLHPHIVQPLSLVLHELISNAVTHGALSDGVGRAVVSWDDDNETTLNLRWHERGPALQSAHIDEKFGLEIVRNVVEQQLGGQMSINLLAGELIATFTMPMAIGQG